jgi:hypothetical protein
LREEAVEEHELLIEQRERVVAAKEAGLLQYELEMEAAWAQRVKEREATWKRQEAEREAAREEREDEIRRLAAWAQYEADEKKRADRFKESFSKLNFPG